MTQDAADGPAVDHPLFARLWARMAPAIERSGAAQHRDRLLTGIGGRVVEPGAGTGANFAHYPPEVTEVLAVEPERHLRGVAAQAARTARVPVTVVDGTAEDIPAGDGTFDAAVVSLVLCSVPDQAAALRELRRVLRPGGRLYFWEHVRAERRGSARVQDLLDRTVWPTVGGGCHTGRDTAAEIAAAGFTIERVERFRFPDGRVPMPTAPQVLGTALRRP
ncbi:class I SAM-dependent methyltransferase [Blastococcus goldschmidtiae]|uniref:Class I SAM-dependent methyltransferase n=1 Tax=Blastococcus goldschmidtiae TaxID=3075546 RepID=A0ABU2K5F4_9ACTN|nr:class I SAM-dependent methyltransferase [Blastococcus sp. DSM 46792]MDT0275371.1 class I SAM-dependent methyltransferase [Blastococcus sp. DSM 46792]